MPDQFTSLAGAVASPAVPASIGPTVVEAERLEESFSTAVAVERKACPRCGDVLLWTGHSECHCITGLACDNHQVCGVWRTGSDLSAEDWWRFCCLRCHWFSVMPVHSTWSPSSAPRVRMRHLSLMRAPPMEAHKLLGPQARGVLRHHPSFSFCVSVSENAASFFHAGSAQTLGMLYSEWISQFLRRLFRHCISVYT